MTRSLSGSVGGASGAAITWTLTPRRSSRRAASRPSLPLLPLPATTTTRRPYEPPSMASARRASAAPARAISTSTGSGAAASTAAISSGVSTGSMGHRPYESAPDGRTLSAPCSCSCCFAAGRSGFDAAFPALALLSRHPRRGGPLGPRGLAYRLGLCAPAPTAITSASATVEVWDRLTCQSAMPRSAARPAAVPCSTSDGAPDPARTTSISRKAHAPSPNPMALSTASLAANRAANRSVGSRRARQSACSSSVYTRAANPGVRASTRRMRSTSHKSMPTPTTALTVRRRAPSSRPPPVCQLVDGLGEQDVDRDLGQQVLPERGFGLQHGVPQHGVSVAVALQHAPGRRHRQAVGEAHVQQRDPGGLAVLDLWHDHDRAPVAPATAHEHLALVGHPVLGAPQLGGPLGAADEVAGDPAPVDHGDGRGRLPRLGAGAALDAVAGV